MSLWCVGVGGDRSVCGVWKWVVMSLWCVGVGGGESVVCAVSGGDFVVAINGSGECVA